MNASSDSAAIPLEAAGDLCREILDAAGFSAAHVAAMTDVILKGQRDECHSHGLYRLLGCVHSVRAGKVDPRAEPRVLDSAPAVVRVDAAHGFSPLAFRTGLPIVHEKAAKYGIAAFAINRCFHFSALWPEVESLSDLGLAGLAMNPTHSLVAPAGGIHAVFGTNPFAFAWPRPGGRPFVFDFATSVVARGEIELHKRSGQPIPLGWALDAQGQPTTDPATALEGAMLPFGAHKGSALSAMIELLAGPLIGDMLSLESSEFDAGAGALPCHGELIIAFDPASFLGTALDANMEKAERLFDAIAGQGARLPSQRRYEARDRASRTGVMTVRAGLIEDLQALLPAGRSKL